MKKQFKVSFLTKHESYSGYDHSDGWKDYVVKAKSWRIAKKKAEKLWEKDFGDSGRHWIQNTIVD